MTHESGQIEHYPLMTTTSGVGKSGYIQQPFGIGTTNSSGHCNANMNMADWRTLMGVTRIRSQLTQKPQQLYGYEYIWNTPQCSKNPWGEWVPPSGYWPAVAIHPSIHLSTHSSTSTSTTTSTTIQKGMFVVCYFDVAGRPAGQANLRINYVTLCGRSGCNSTAIKIANHR